MRLPKTPVLALALLLLPAYLPANDIEVLKARLLADYLTGPVSKAPDYLAGLGPDGSWPDIDYRDQSRAIWKPSVHLDRLVVMATAYRSPKSKLRASPGLLAGIQSSLSAWFRLGLRADNWWFNTIGNPQHLMRVLVLMDGDLGPDLRASILAALPDPDQVPASVATGENLVWHASEQLVRGVMGGNPGDIGRASAFLQRDLRISQSEGIQADYSFHQHGAQLYSGGYGLGFVQDTSYYAQLLSGTAWAFSQASLDTLAACILDGTARMARGGRLDPAVRGREPSRPRSLGSAQGLYEAAGRLAPLVPDRRAELEALASAPTSPGLYPPLWTGNRAFWRSDYMSHSRPGFFASVRMVSRRTIGTELVNGENPRGYWLPFGATSIMRRGDEYEGIWATWDFARIPGTTSPHEVPPLTPRFSQAEDLVGMVSDGRLGLAAMAQDKDGTRARKAWFLFDEGLVALGSGIWSDSREAVGTTLNQCLLKGPILDSQGAVPGGQLDLSGRAWVLHDGIAYLPGPSSKLSLLSGKARGSWKAINADSPADPVEAGLFCLWIDHGQGPEDASYSYTILPGADGILAGAWASAPPIRILANRPSLEAVFDERSGTLAAAFFEAGSLAMPDGSSLAVDRPALVLLTRKEGRVWASLADPRQGSGKVSLTLTGGPRPGRLSLDLPSGNGREGSTVTAEW